MGYNNTRWVWRGVKGDELRWDHSTEKPVTTMLTYTWKCTVLHCNHLGNTWKPLVLMTRHFDYCPSASEGDNQSVRSSAPVVSRCFPGGYNVKLDISRGRLAWWLLTFLHSGMGYNNTWRGVKGDELRWDVKDNILWWGVKDDELHGCLCACLTRLTSFAYPNIWWCL